MPLISLFVARKVTGVASEDYTSNLMRKTSDKL